MDYHYTRACVLYKKHGCAYICVSLCRLLYVVSIFAVFAVYWLLYVLLSTQVASKITLKN